MDTIIQWNLQGMTSAKEDILQLTEEHKPIVLAFQETFYSNDFKAKIPHYHGICKQGHFNHRFHGGVALYIHSSCPYQPINIQTTLQVVAAKIQLHNHRALTIASIYIPGRSRLSLADLRNVVAQLPTPYFLLGDFNGHNPIWGGNSIDTRGRLIEDFITQERLNCLNDGRPTHESGSSIDLSICTPDIAVDAE